MPHYPFGPPDRFRSVAEGLGAPILGELPVVPGVSAGGDRGLPFALVGGAQATPAEGQWIGTMEEVAQQVWRAMGQRGAVLS
jgi:ATP-binding protein involved in chromosome partitioning